MVEPTLSMASSTYLCDASKWCVTDPGAISTTRSTVSPGRSGANVTVWSAGFRSEYGSAAGADRIRGRAGLIT